MERYILHITSKTEWEAALKVGEYLPARFDEEGFIHSSTKAQVLGPANLFYKGQRDLILLHIDTALVEPRIVYENLEGGEQHFPHIYGPLSVAAIIATHQFPPGPDGTFELPMALR